MANHQLYNIQRSIKYFPNCNGDAPNNSPHSTWEYINVDNCSDQIAISLAVRPIPIQRVQSPATNATRSSI